MSGAASAAHPAVVVGAGHVDRRARSAQPYRAGASNPGRLQVSVGGAGLNAASAMRAFGAPVGLIGARGGDADGERVAETLAAAGIADLATTWLDRATPSYTAILDDRGELVAGVADMALYDLISPRLLQRRHIREALAAAPSLLVDANLPVATLEAVVEGAAGRPVAAIGVSPAKVGRLAALLPALSLLFVSRAEAAVLARTEAREAMAPADLALRLAALGVRRAVVTDGPHPLAVLEDGAVRLLAPPPLGAVADVTGAGDCLAGTAFQAVCRGMPLAEAAALGVAASCLLICGLPATTPGFAAQAERFAARLAPPVQPGETRDDS
ncbi:PfkB family carbohydrate kinase [Mangrovibrevibacter kandeliae]|uniref:PfkB family carbohydrate kinase n=1 Tax=Mangrovibrevibacter kandeliae TaxID=2968473 RepID=UPI002118E07F|nr:PfkB family carbohydrate kinase [Aurantimonas sp. CSK15Z-1]